MHALDSRKLTIPESTRLWSDMDRHFQKVCTDHIQVCLEKQNKDMTFTTRLDDLLRDICVAKHEPLIRKLASSLKLVPEAIKPWSLGLQDVTNSKLKEKNSDFLETVAFFQSTTGNWIVKGTRNVVCPADAINKLIKYKALFDHRRCFDSIRRSFFLRAENSRLQFIQMLEKIAASQNKSCVVEHVCKHLRSRCNHATNGLTGDINAPEKFETLV